MPEVATMKDRCAHRLLVVGPGPGLEQFDRDLTPMDIPGATDIELLEHSPTRRAWQFVADGPASNALRSMSRRWPSLTFFAHFDCEDQRLIGLIRARNGRLHQRRFKY
jgi:hypothetical protein